MASLKLLIRLLIFTASSFLSVEGNIWQIYDLTKGGSDSFGSPGSPIANTRSASEVDPFCGAPDGLFSHPYDCREFFSCANGRGCLLECPIGTHFHKVLNICVWPHQAPCTPKPGPLPAHWPPLEKCSDLKPGPRPPRPPKPPTPTPSHPGGGIPPPRPTPPPPPKPPVHTHPPTPPSTTFPTRPPFPPSPQTPESSPSRPVFPITTTRPFPITTPRPIHPITPYPCPCITQPFPLPGEPISETEKPSIPPSPGLPVKPGLPGVGESGYPSGKPPSPVTERPIDRPQTGKPQLPIILPSPQPDTSPLPFPVRPEPGQTVYPTSTTSKPQIVYPSPVPPKPSQPELPPESNTNKPYPQPVSSVRPPWPQPTPGTSTPHPDRPHPGTGSHVRPPWPQPIPGTSTPHPGVPHPGPGSHVRPPWPQPIPGTSTPHPDRPISKPRPPHPVTITDKPDPVVPVWPQLPPSPPHPTDIPTHPTIPPIIDTIGGGDRPDCEKCCCDCIDGEDDSKEDDRLRYGQRPLSYFYSKYGHPYANSVGERTPVVVVVADPNNANPDWLTNLIRSGKR